MLRTLLAASAVTLVALSASSSTDPSPTPSKGNEVWIDTPRGEPHVAVVYFYNGTETEEVVQTTSFTLYGELEFEAVVHNVTNYPEDTPDRLTVTTPPGYFADPPEIEVPEGEIGVIYIFEELLT